MNAPQAHHENRAPSATVVARTVNLEQVATRMGRAERFAFDVEANGMFAFRARICTVQLAAGADIVVTDTLATGIGPLRSLLAPSGPVKIVHDAAFDARLLAEHGIELGNAHDTAIAARMLGRKATGLANLLLGELGIVVDKRMQHHDWSERPIDDAMLAYLVGDVQHLELLYEKLWGEVRATGIEDEVLEEGLYRIACAIKAGTHPDLEPAYARLKGVDTLSRVELAIARHLVDAREAEARRRDMPVHAVLPGDAIIHLARLKPTTTLQLGKVRRLQAGADCRPFAETIVAAVARGLHEGDIPKEHYAWVKPPKLSAEQVKALREREQRLNAWRKLVALEKKVDEQVILPGHCVKELAARGVRSIDELSTIAGLGQFRIKRDGKAIVRALEGGSG